MTDPAADPLETLRRYFGHASFRAGQRDPPFINAISGDTTRVTPGSRTAGS